MSQRYKIVFLGVTLHGFDVEQIKQDLQQLLALNDGQIDSAFSGQRITLRDGLLLEEGRALEKALKSIGLFIYLEEDNAPPARKKTTLALYKKRLKRTYLPKRVDEGFSVLQARHRNNLEVEVEVPSSFELSFQGRFGRLNYLNNLWCIYGIAIVCGAGMIFFDIAHSYLWVALMTAVIASLLSIRAVILRLHDLNKNGWYALILLSSCVPYIGGIIYLGFTQSLMFSRGSIIDNDYGLPAKQGHIAGLILTCATSLFLIVTLSMFGIPVYQDYVLKSYVVESMVSMDELKTLVADYHATYNSWPSSNYDVGLTFDQSNIKNKNIAGNVRVTYGGKIVVYYGKKFNGETIVLTPEMNNEQYQWDCYGGTLQSKYRPAMCIAE